MKGKARTIACFSQLSSCLFQCSYISRYWFQLPAFWPCGCFYIQYSRLPIGSCHTASTGLTIGFGVTDHKYVWGLVTHDPPLTSRVWDLCLIIWNMLFHIQHPQIRILRFLLKAFQKFYSYKSIDIYMCYTFQIIANHHMAIISQVAQSWEILSFSFSFS